MKCKKYHVRKELHHKGLNINITGWEGITWSGTKGIDIWMVKYQGLKVVKGIEYRVGEERVNQGEFWSGRERVKYQGNQKSIGSAVSTGNKRNSCWNTHLQVCCCQQNNTQLQCRFCSSNGTVHIVHVALGDGSRERGVTCSSPTQGIERSALSISLLVHLKLGFCTQTSIWGLPEKKQVAFGIQNWLWYATYNLERTLNKSIGVLTWQDDRRNRQWILSLLYKLAYCTAVSKTCDIHYRCNWMPWW